MSGSTGERGTYLLDAGDEDLARLLRIAEISAASVREDLDRAGIRPGARALDCGCGPLGALAVLAEAVGPSGQVMGVDFNPATVDQARSVVRALGHENVDVRVGDVNQLGAEELGAPFDVAYSRCFLMHQPDPRATLRRIGELLRPGGWLVAHEPLPVPPPTSEPPIAELAAYWTIIQATMRRLGADADTGKLPGWAQDAGFEVANSRGFFLTIPAPLGFDLHATTLAASRERAVSCGAATAQHVDGVVAALRSAVDGDYDWVSSPVYLGVALRRR
jgi:SAM-dependent methyltransferase